MGAPINDRDAMGQTALHYAVCHSNALQLVTIITESGAQVDPERQRDGWTPLHLASMFGKTDVAIKLLEMGADPTMKGTSGDTAEDVAKRYKNHRLADVLHRY
jgi:ankyrin repeat protein